MENENQGFEWAKKKIEKWYNDNSEEITPELIDVCYQALIKNLTREEQAEVAAAKPPWKEMWKQ